MRFIALVSGLLATLGVSSGMLVRTNQPNLNCNRCVAVSEPCHNQYLMLIKITGEHFDNAKHDRTYKYDVIHDFYGNAGHTHERRPLEYPNKVCQSSFNLGQTYLVAGGGEWFKNDLQASKCDTYIHTWNHDPTSAAWELAVKEIEKKCHRTPSPIGH